MVLNCFHLCALVVEGNVALRKLIGTLAGTTPPEQFTHQ